MFNLLDNLSDGIALFEKGSLIFVSPGYKKMLGYDDLSQLKTLEDIYSLIHPGDIEKLKNEIEIGIKQKKELQKYQFRVKHKDGSYCWIENSIKREFNAEGKSIRAFIASRDISERKLKEDQLRKSEERYRSLFSHNSIGILATDLSGTIIEANQKMEKILGYAPGEMLSKSVYALVYPDDSNIFRHIPGQAKNSSLLNKTHTCRMNHKTNRLIWVESHFSVVYDHDNNAETIIVSVQDISWRKAAEKTLDSTQKTLQAIVDNTTALIYTKDAEGKYTFVNRAFSRMYKMPYKEIIGKDDTEIDTFDVGAAERLRANDMMVIHGQKPIAFEEQMQLNDGLHTAISVKVPLFDMQGRVAGICGITTDITQRKRDEEALKDLKEKILERNKYLSEINLTKEKLFSVISHDLVNPLNSLLGFAQLLNVEIRNIGHPQLETLMKMVNKSADSIAQMLETLTQWSQSQRGKIKVRLKQLQAKALVDDVFALVYTSAHAKQIKLINTVLPNTMAFADEEMIKTILRNLISNAIKFSYPDSSILVEGDENNGFVFKISDKGIGIAPEQLKQLFRVSTYESQFGTAGEKGTGLGLLICKEFAELNGGKLWAESTQGKGSSFYLALPARS